MIFLDFDGVMFDTEVNLFGENYQIAKKSVNFDKHTYIANIDWYKLIQ